MDDKANRATLPQREGATIHLFPNSRIQKQLVTLFFSSHQESWCVLDSNNNILCNGSLCETKTWLETHKDSHIVTNHGSASFESDLLIFKKITFAYLLLCVFNCFIIAFGSMTYIGILSVLVSLWSVEQIFRLNKVNGRYCTNWKEFAVLWNQLRKV